MNANFVCSFLHLDLNDDGVEDDIQYLNPCINHALINDIRSARVEQLYCSCNMRLYAHENALNQTSVVTLPSEYLYVYTFNID